MGMSIKDMQTYLKNRGRGAAAANEQIALLETQQLRLTKEAHSLKLRRQYVATKVAYWQAVAIGDTVQVGAMRERAHAIAKELKLPVQE
jgi:hypothetical protein